MLFALCLTMLLLFPSLLLTQPNTTLTANGTAESLAPATPLLTPFVLDITMGTFNTTVYSHEVVFINFYADWCFFSKRLAPIFEEAAVELAKEYPKEGSVRLARVDCMSEEELATTCSINKFPTLILYYRGQPLRQEYRGARSVQALVEYVRQQMRLSIQTLNSVEQLDMIDGKRRTVIGFFKNRTNAEVANFELLAERYKNDCDFYIRVGERVENMTYTHDMPKIVFRPDLRRTHALDESFGGKLSSSPELEDWLFKKCVPLVREVDFGNVEEIIEQRLPLLVLFHMPDDVDSVKDFKSIVEMQLVGCENCGQFNYVTVDGRKFQHSVQHMGKTIKDLPIIAIDSLKYMFPYSKFKDIYIPGHLKNFIQNFSSHHLQHKLKLNVVQDGENSPPSSTFKKLGPSKHRYTLVGHDEL